MKDGAVGATIGTLKLLLRPSCTALKIFDWQEARFLGFAPVLAHLPIKMLGKSRMQIEHLGIAGGSGEIRTHERVPPPAVFKTAAFNHSATLPEPGIIQNHRPSGSP